MHISEDRMQREKEAAYLENLNTELCEFNFKATQNDMFRTHQEGTGDWFVSDAKFKAWVRGDDRILFCPGIPGAGKSVLASFVINHLKAVATAHNTTTRTSTETSMRQAVSFVYCNYKEREQMPIKLLANILGQVVSCLPFVTDELKCLFRRLRVTLKSLNAIRETLEHIIQHFNRVFIVVDALDELTDGEDGRDALVEALQTVALQSQRVSILVTSRPLPGITELFKNNPAIDIVATDSDLTGFITSRISNGSRRLKKIIGNDQLLQKEVIAKVLTSANGMFLLAKLQMDSLNMKHSRKDLRAALDTLPQKLYSVYDDTVRRIRAQDENDRRLAMSVLGHISFFMVPLTIGMLQSALAMAPGETDIDEESLIDAGILVDVCCGLTTVDSESNIVRLVHQTVQEYFEAERGTLFPEVEILIARQCLTFMTIPTRYPNRYPFLLGLPVEFRRDVPASKYYITPNDGISEPMHFNDEVMKLVRYAYREGWLHLHHLQHVRIVQSELLEVLHNPINLKVISALRSCPCRNENFKHTFEVPCAGNEAAEKQLQQHPGDSERRISMYSPFHMAAFLGLDTIVTLLLNTQAHAQLYERVTSGQTALGCAARSGRTEVVALILQKMRQIGSWQLRQGLDSIFYALDHWPCVSLILQHFTEQVLFERNASSGPNGVVSAIRAPGSEAGMSMSGINAIVSDAMHSSNDGANTELYLQILKNDTGLLRETLLKAKFITPTCKATIFCRELLLLAVSRKGTANESICHIINFLTQLGIACPMKPMRCTTEKNRISVHFNRERGWRETPPRCILYDAIRFREIPVVRHVIANLLKTSGTVARPNISAILSGILDRPEGIFEEPPRGKTQNPTPLPVCIMMSRVEVPGSFKHIVSHLIPRAIVNSESDDIAKLLIRESSLKDEDSDTSELLQCLLDAHRKEGGNVIRKFVAYGRGLHEDDLIFYATRSCSITALRFLLRITVPEGQISGGAFAGVASNYFKELSDRPFTPCCVADRDLDIIRRTSLLYMGDFWLGSILGNALCYLVDKLKFTLRMGVFVEQQNCKIERSRVLAVELLLQAVARTEGASEGILQMHPALYGDIFRALVINDSHVSLGYQLVSLVGGRCLNLGMQDPVGSLLHRAILVFYSRWICCQSGLADATSTRKRWKDSFEIIKMISKKVDLAATDESGRTASDLALSFAGPACCDAGNLDVVEIIEKGMSWELSRGRSFELHLEGELEDGKNFRSEISRALNRFKSWLCDDEHDGELRLYQRRWEELSICSPWCQRTHALRERVLNNPVFQKTLSRDFGIHNVKRLRIV
ncbi:hypothetical protein BJ508DRAFT_181265 [Ascobolus immersus RN42]|uniref:NACHT domain-containing protein n=1 Tax=Ascobolus immersus RN42 TaxID=1160509 RepID=A0A3N4HUL9_ASCIM|nr:hypothetical protein BJ508DRAFT_181265 [Ascobolus immersus RN42]